MTEYFKAQLADEPPLAEHIETDKCCFDRAASMMLDAYVCGCGWTQTREAAEDTKA